eukprot:CAMPEP_0183304012 /NCGR_PEP_ID=MMETSP0160_2-20130417/9243_1 /TAXON_ID=2839 ORGANISM="Odontella Sinensis, Strain Grunow 1884" /NCGR_SAMPLE_ID=MMETSP0160_2 /ASSEMBLY_ACC=CAM_ASM_000250 /LENGTH=86 /DNA_ID=CAMNT_0025466997 /DNA_START=80 /DNA_END=340 /DNA_ORIENTATION=-
MGLSATLFGAASGFSIQMLTNSARKVPLSRSPWLHVSYAIFGAWAANYYVDWEIQTVKDINQLRADRGMPPLVGHKAWIKYQVADE